MLKIKKFFILILLLILIIIDIFSNHKINIEEIKNIIEISITIYSLVFGFALTSISMFFQNDNFNKILNYQEYRDKSVLIRYLDNNKKFLCENIFCIFINLFFLYIFQFINYNFINKIIFYLVFICNFYILYKTYNFITILIIDYQNTYSKESENILKLINRDKTNKNF